MAQTAQKPMTIDEFLDWQSLQDKNYELVDGIPVLPLKSMTGATQRHDRIVVNFLATLHQQLRRGPCRPSTDDIALVTRGRSIRRPDVTVQCGEADPKGLVAVSPYLVVEVLSPSTMNYDRFKKIDEYKAVRSIQSILLCDTETPRVAVRTRESDIDWSTLEYSGLEAEIRLPDIGVNLALRDVFEGVHSDDS
jgi:Uma2 family endonuclease